MKEDSWSSGHKKKPCFIQFKPERQYSRCGPPLLLTITQKSQHTVTPTAARTPLNVIILLVSQTTIQYSFCWLITHPNRIYSTITYLGWKVEQHLNKYLRTFSLAEKLEAVGVVFKNKLQMKTLSQDRTDKIKWTVTRKIHAACLK